MPGSWADDRIVAVGLLTRRDLDVLGLGFSRHFPVAEDDAFGELLAKLDGVEATSAARRIKVTVAED
ncbi:hypothetical protein [uncultured Sphingomonas sp.]|uniref:hypothetical protein n=1 Tax=uncultured Sphingomonas sp. TaxID=158754 RepID=UPI0035CBBC8A